jgi:hypothetical protein
MLSTLLTIALFSPCAALAQAPAMPHASLPVGERPGEAVLQENQAGFGRWVVLEPSWVALGTDLVGDSRLALLNRVAAARDLADDVVLAWQESTSPQPVVVNYRVLADGVEVLAGRESVPMGTAFVMSDSRRKSEILDFDVEIASGSVILDPIICQQYSGTSLALEIFPLPGLGWQVEVALVHSTSENSQLIDAGYAQMDGKMRLIEHVAECGFVAAMKPASLLHMELSNLGPGKVTVEMQLEGTLPKTLTQLGDNLYLLAVPTFARDLGWSNYLSQLEEQSSLWSNGQGYLVFEGEHALETASAAAQVATARARPVSLDVSVQTVRDGVEEDPALLRFHGLENRVIRFAQGTVRDALIDWDVEVAQVARVADPVFENLFSGAQGKFVARRRADGKMEVDLDLKFSTVNLPEPRQIRLGAATVGEMGFDGKVPAAPAQDLALEIPEVAELHFQGTYVADENGRIVLVRSARSLLGDATRLRVVVQLSSPQ